MSRAAALITQAALDFGARPAPSTAADWLRQRAQEYRRLGERLWGEGDTDNGMYLKQLASDLNECAAAVEAVGGAA